MSAPVLTAEREDDGSIELNWSFVNFNTMVHRYNFETSTWSQIALVTYPPSTTQYLDKSSIGVRTAYYISYIDSSDATIVSNTVTVTPQVLFNCDCMQVLPWRTLSELRTDMMYRLGYAAVADNPPPGMNGLLYRFLRDAQIQLSKMPKFQIQMERFFSWTMEPGGRYYDILGYDDVAGVASVDQAGCNAAGAGSGSLDPNKVTFVGFEDLNGAWYRLAKGIDPLMYTRAQISNGWPTNYEIRGCIEIFPAPQAAYTLWVKGQFGLAPFLDDSSDPSTTIDDEIVFLLALGMAKMHYGQRDAQAVMTQAQSYIRNLVAGSHQTGRYVPRARPAGVLTPPHFIPLDTE